MFAEIEKGYDGEPSIFDNIRQTDVIMAFFPCVRFECKIPLEFRGEAFQQKSWSDERKLKYSIDLHGELHRNYVLISKLSLIALNRNLKLIIENPYTQPHYLTTYWCLKPKVIDKNRRNNGDYMKKPTQFWFVGFEPKYNIIMESIEYTELRKHDTMQNKDGKSRTERRSEIHPQYANRFIRQYILGEDFKQEKKKQITMYDLFEM